ncbi:quinone oxidoreductase [Tardiphaga sp.]|uniref:quinone oxidoreductase family protein n=1 Tax=Tardiphaga sp. TaxID=1926292 RepID=UPI002604ADCB|nr:quinone oxidoreductase [Tardiphaga sp.]MDB5619842.1 Alcohol dehydrogenase zinc-binding domain protein [Tardiphaga sp.]
MKTSVVRIHRHGGPDVLQYEEVELSAPGPGEVQIRQTAIGLNFSDVYQREGEAGPHDSGTMPMILGGQGAGVVEAVGPGIDTFKPGDRVAYISPGAYAECRNVGIERLLHLPAGISDQIAAATLLRGLTAEYLVRRLYKVKPGHTVLVHAAAGGMGLILGQWAKALGARVIGTVGADSKIDIAKAHGCDEVIVYTREDFAARTMELTGGIGVDVIYDGVGKDAFLKSLDCVRPMGMVISYGTASGNVGKFDLQLLHRKSIIVTRPTLRTWIASRADLEAAAAAFFDAVISGKVRAEVNRSYSLRDIRRAHEELQSRSTTGAAIIVP